jgi:hypothetical protein
MKDHLFAVRSRRSNYPAIVTALVVDYLLSRLTLRRHPEQGFSALYIDPGSGILIWQLLAAAVAGFVFNIRRSIALVIRHRHPEKD